MTVRGNLLLGALVGFVSILCGFILPSFNFTMLAFVGGMVFGKGYALYQERENRD